jgi:hypothetical protein
VWIQKYKEKIMVGDIDLDFGDRNEILSHIDYTTAIIDHKTKHNSGVYITLIPQNPITGFASIDYKKAEELGYFKLDILNQSVYKMIKNEQHLEDLLNHEIHWARLLEESFVKQLVHIGNYYDLIRHLPESITNINHLSMFLAIIRPGKKHLQNLPWSIVEKTVWDKEHTEGYSFKKSHSYAYAHMIVMQMAFIESQEK